MALVKICPTKNSLKYIGKKWTLEIIRDLFFGKTRFSEFLQENPGITKKILSERLKELEEENFITRKVISESPKNIAYHLTEKGYRLNKILYELSLLSIDYYKDDIFTDLNNPQNEELMISYSKQYFQINDD